MTDEELQEINDNMRRTEEEGLKNILKYFDRIHDKIFSFNNILIGGYFFLAKFDEEVSFYTILVPLLNLGFIIYIEYRMMENSRVQSNITNISLDAIQKNNRAQNKTNLYSLATIFTTLIVTLVFLFNLFSISNQESSVDTQRDIQVDTILTEPDTASALIEIDKADNTTKLSDK